MENNYQIDDERANLNFSIHYDCGTLIAEKDRIEFESLEGAQGKIVIDFTPPRVCPFITECYEKKYEKLSLPSDSEGFDFFISNSGYVSSDTKFKTFAQLWVEYRSSCIEYNSLFYHWRDFFKKLIEIGFKMGRHPENNKLIVFCRKNISAKCNWD